MPVLTDQLPGLPGSRQSPFKLRRGKHLWLQVVNSDQLVGALQAPGQVADSHQLMQGPDAADAMGDPADAPAAQQVCFSELHSSNFSTSFVASYTWIESPLCNVQASLQAAVQHLLPAGIAYMQPVSPMSAFSDVAQEPADAQQQPTMPGQSKHSEIDNRAAQQRQQRMQLQCERTEAFNKSLKCPSQFKLV